MDDRTDDEIAELLDAVGALSDRVRALEGRRDAGGLTGTSPEAQENRAIRGARARLAQQRARTVRGELSELRDRTAALAEQAKRVAAASGTPVSRGAAAPPREGARLPEVLDRAARDMLSRPRDEQYALDHTLRLIVAGAVAAIPHADRVGVLLLEPQNTPQSRAPSDDLVADLDAVQVRLREGPCHDATRRANHLVIEDTRTDGRWPRFAAAAAERGVLSVLSLHLFADDDRPAGALNVYADRAGAFDASSVEVGSLFASHASLVLHGARRITGLTEALRTRDLIGQAKGILAERHGLTEEQAFAMLVSSSQEVNLKLAVVAEWLVTQAGPRVRDAEA